MAENSIPKNRVRISNKKSLLEIRIPLKKNTKALVAMIFATGVWVFALFIMVGITLKHTTHFWIEFGLILAILGWFAMGMAGASFFIWLFFGRERILINKEFFITDKPLVFFYRRNFYDVKDIRNIRTDVEIYKANRNGNWIDEQRTVIKFDTTNKLVTFARGVTKAEAEYILLQLAQSSYLDKIQFAVEHRI
ncbi:MAG: hypothetical protein IPM95_12085 [Sphingobacteriales bacterium]|nr:hypothetical protein [Sphingobacteriales bacterium]